MANKKVVHYHCLPLKMPLHLFITLYLLSVHVDTEWCWTLCIALSVLMAIVWAIQLAHEEWVDIFENKDKSKEGK